MTGTRALVRLILRRDRVILPIWVLLLAIMPVTQISAIGGLYSTDAELQSFAASMRATPAFFALYGPLLDWHVAALGVWRAGFVPVILGLAGLLTVIRHTRAEEESGRRELLGSTVLGRHAPLAAALIVVASANVIAGLIVAGSLAGTYPVAGALAAGLDYALVGIAFAAIGAVAAQLTESASGARVIGISALGLAFLLRMAGDTTDASWLSWLSPIAWGQKLRPFAGEEWWPLALFAAFIAVTCYAAYTLAARRDIAAGLLPPRLGPAQAAPGLAGPLALAWRLHRGLLLAWCAGFAVFGAVIGSAADAASSALRQNAQIMEMLNRLGGGTDPADLFIAALISIFGIAVSGYAIQAALRLRTEESLARAEPLLATAVSRVGWAAGHMLFAVLGPAAVLAVTGLAVGLSYGAASGDIAAHLPATLGAALAQLPAVWIFSGLALALFGLLPRLVAAAWAVLALFLLFGQVGALLELPQVLLDLSPFSHLPTLPGGEVSATPLAAMTAIAAALAIAGLYGFRRRDVG
ncbi:ABC transporter permease [Streptosporangium sp. NBC_01810]|uniref:ABC transporter permease n=1 Tax=Streptosporangium sp. NBC_01810 TaxID=2975951 RepID=UPI002DD9C809|nr:ABC transporter permease [Streptosporangium sp. NBC_01810]WSA26034.1 ABC transporter permease [Streptosporangium sp. NBC_01810]